MPSLEDWEDYVAAGLGGVAAGEVLLYTVNPIAAGAAGGFATNVSKQGLNNLSGDQEGWDLESIAVDTGVGAALSLIFGGKVPGVTQGKNSLMALFKQMVTKAKKGQIGSMKWRTAMNMAIGRAENAAVGPGALMAAIAGGTGAIPSPDPPGPQGDNALPGSRPLCIGTSAPPGMRN